MRPIYYSQFRKLSSPFTDPRYGDRLVEYGFQRAPLLSSQVIFTRSFSLAKKAAALFPLKKIIVWTNEPRYDSSAEALQNAYIWKKIYIFNVFCGNVFWHNRHYLGSAHFLDITDFGIRRGQKILHEQLLTKEEFNGKKLCVGIFAKQNESNCRYMISGKNVDLREYRQSMAMQGYQRGLCDVAGKNWSIEVIEDTGYGQDSEIPWWARKITLLKDYRFNLAFENTVWPYYVTEKIWHSIVAGTLPVYWGKGSSIYESFPQDSFVDASEFPSIEELWNFLGSMSYEDWRKRMGKCIDAFNTEMAICQDTKYNYFEEIIERVKEFAFEGDS